MTKSVSWELTELEFNLAAGAAFSHALHCKRCAKHYERIVQHTTKIQNKVNNIHISHIKEEWGK